MKRLAIVVTHPIQYYAPLFQLLEKRKRISIKVFYTGGAPDKHQYDPGFGKIIAWDIPLLDGYPYEWVENVARSPGSSHFRGIVNPTLVHSVAEFKPDALLVFGWAYQSHLHCLRYFSGKIPVYFRGDSTLLDDSSFLKKLARKLLLSWVYHFIDHIFYVGTRNKAYFKKFGVKENQLTFAPHAIDNQRFSVSRTKEAEQLRAQLHLGEKDILILFAGKLESKKAPLLLLEAFLNLKQENLHLLIAGNGKLEAALKTTAHDAHHVHFMDFQNQQFMPVIYQAADLFCLPSQGPGETWGLAVNEAMASELAVVVSDKVGCAADLISEQNGAIFKSGDLAGLINALKILTADKERLKEQGQRSKTIIEQWNFTNIVLPIEKKLLNEKN